MPASIPPRTDNWTVITGPDFVQLELDFNRTPQPLPVSIPDDYDGPIWNSREEHAAFLADLRRKAAARSRARRQNAA
jgi:hypothetical protein